jgi:hypothetical protein
MKTHNIYTYVYWNTFIRAQQLLGASQTTMACNISQCGNHYFLDYYPIRVSFSCMKKNLNFWIAGLISSCKQQLQLKIKPFYLLKSEVWEHYD